MAAASLCTVGAFSFGADGGLGGCGCGEGMVAFGAQLFDVGAVLLGSGAQLRGRGAFGFEGDLGGGASALDLLGAGRRGVQLLAGGVTLTGEGLDVLARRRRGTSSGH